jgi:hypothetical protein
MFQSPSSTPLLLPILKPGTLKAAAWAALHSAYITFLAILSGLTAQAVATGQTSSPGQFVLYLKSAWFPWVIANTVAPGLRALLAAHQNQKDT